MNKQMIIDELDQLKSEKQITDYAHGSLTNLINEPEKQLLIHSVSSSRFLDLDNLEEKTDHNARVISDFMKYCKTRKIDISDRIFEGYFEA